ncbi:H-type small acid-soluble spore protein [Brevibacillus dissolubilis]|uniref:H-type small acid-soluble spore protein n=1 Tax=Brevibacillus dissolubilis TaxID=1844116 RepID=UPI001115DA49|nr:H-type small acid-soluble spore protein [Brevibacillus dissolubilis]
MDFSRVQQIMKSEQKIDVEYQGTPVWIDAVEEQSQSVRIHEEGQPDARHIVKPQDLVERG